MIKTDRQGFHFVLVEGQCYREVTAIKVLANQPTTAIMFMEHPEEEEEEGVGRGREREWA